MSERYVKSKATILSKYVRNAAALAVCLAASFAAATSGAQAKISLPSFISDYMMLQRDTPIRIWGSAEPNQPVRVQLGNEVKDTRTVANGEFAVEFKPLSAGTKPVLTISQPAVTGADSKVVKAEQLEIQHITVGDVFICAGQSNMEKTVDECEHVNADILKSKDAELRVFVSKINTEQSDSTISGNWIYVTPDTVTDIAALPYYIARELRTIEKVPIGIIQCSASATQIRAWISPNTLAAMPEDKTNRKPIPDSSMFNAAIGPLSGLGTKGIIWYQGETDILRTKVYPELFITFVAETRKIWKRDSLPVYFVQLPNSSIKMDHPTDSYWAEFRECQIKSLALPECYMAVTYDTAMEKPVSACPKDKKKVAHRLALLIRQHGYNESIDVDPIVPTSITFNGSSATVKFDKGPLTMDGDGLKGFELAGIDGIYYPATAHLTGSTIQVQSAKVKAPKTIRFAWADNPAAFLYGPQSCPVAPFRTDKLPARAPLLAPQVPI